ncbi:MAG TPA: hypothetical protein V6C65_26190 [Allocoleopsis sp.]
MSANVFKKMPLKDIEKLITIHYGTCMLIQSALRDIPALPKEVFANAFGVFNAQLNVMVKEYQKRSKSETKTQKMMDRVQAAVQPEVSHGQV